MVAQRKKSKASTPLPATPNRKVSDPDTPGSVVSQQRSPLRLMTLPLSSIFWVSTHSIPFNIYMNDLGDLRDIGLTNAHAQMLMKDAKALHANKDSSSPSISPSATPEHDKAKEKRFIAWSGRLEGTPGGTHNCTSPALLAWLTALLCFIEAQCSSLGVHLREFCRDPGNYASPRFHQVAC